MKNYFISAACFFIVCIIFSCGKGSLQPDSGGTYISAITIKASCPNCTPYTGVTNYSYNSNHQLISEITTSAQLNDTSLYSYNAQGQLAGVYVSNSAAGPIENDVFLYDAKGRIIRKTGIPLSFNLVTDDVTFTYDANNRVIADSVHYDSTAQITYYQVFVYDNNENIIRISQFDVSNGTSQLSYVQNLTYNEKLNPYYALKDVYFFETVDPLSLNRNMSIDTSKSTSSQYTYYSNGLPRELVYKNPAEGDVNTTDYSYRP